MSPPSMNGMEPFRKCGTVCSAANGVGAVMPGADMCQVKLHCCGDPDRMLSNGRCELDYFIFRCRGFSTSKTVLDLVLCSWQLATEARSLTTMTACTMPLANIKQKRTNMSQQTAGITFTPQHPTLTTSSPQQERRVEQHCAICFQRWLHPARWDDVFTDDVFSLNMQMRTKEKR